MRTQTKKRLEKLARYSYNVRSILNKQGGFDHLSEEDEKILKKELEKFKGKHL